MLKISFNGSDERLMNALRNKPQKILEVVFAATNKLMAQLQARIVGEKLQGQVLRHVSGKLAGSIRVLPTEVQGAVVIGQVEGAGGPAFYGKSFELGEQHGGMGTFVTSAQAMHAVINARDIFFRSFLRKPITARPFMAPTLQEMAPQIREDIAAAVRTEIEKP